MNVARFGLLCLILSSCGGENWSCRIEGVTMFSISDSGDLGGAQRGCSCDQIRDFEQRTFGAVDYDALRTNFGCRFKLHSLLTPIAANQALPEALSVNWSLR